MRARYFTAALLLASASIAFAQTGNGVLRSRDDGPNVPGCFGFLTADGRNVCLPAMVPVDPTTGNLAVGSGGGGGGGGATTIANGADQAEGNTNAAAYNDPTLAANGTLVGLNKGQYGLLNTIANRLTPGVQTQANSLPVALASDGPVGQKADAAYTDNTLAAAGSLIALNKAQWGTLLSMYARQGAAPMQQTGGTVAATEADGANVALGSRADPAATTTDATATSLIAQIKQLVVVIKTLTTNLATPTLNTPATQCFYQSTAITTVAGYNPCYLTSAGELRTMLFASGNPLSAQTGTATLAAANYGLATNSRIYLSNGTAGALVPDIIGATAGTGSGLIPTGILPTTSANQGTTPVVSTAVTSSQVIKASAGNLFGLNVTAGATAGFVMLFNATTAPADGAVTPVRCIPVAANQGVEFNWRPIPLVFSTGITAVFSSTGCFNKTASATAFISGDAK